MVSPCHRRLGMELLPIGSVSVAQERVQMMCLGAAHNQCNSDTFPDDADGPDSARQAEYTRQPVSQSQRVARRWRLNAVCKIKAKVFD